MLCRCVEKNLVLVEQVQVADRFWTRFKGLLGRQHLSESEGLLIRPCHSVHTMGMKFVIGVVFLDAENRVLHLIEEMKPSRFSPLIRGSKQVLELHPARLAQGLIQVGHRVVFVDGDEAP